MAQHIPFDDVKQLFDENKSKSWSGLHKVLEQHKGKAEGIEDSTISTLLIITNQLDQSHETYPMSAEQLQRVFDNELNKITA